MKIPFGKTRKGITPVIATVILIAVTLIAAVAITGFTFGLFGSFTSSAQVTVTSVVLVHSASSGALSLAYGACTTAAPAGSYVQLSNSGTASVAVSSVSMNSGGTTQSGAPSGTCTLSAAGGATPVEYVAITVTTTPSSGTSFTGAVVLANGASVPLTGTIQ